ncbi:MAG: 30S ribosomal protein S2 [Candidatus Spechtbacterales bacterium]|nr:30S ribosomal protein S2 [Candidatus Spechtbacterales bacterium]
MTTQKDKETKTKEVSEDEAVQELPKELEEFVEAGVQFGHEKSTVHPGMFPYIFGVRNNAHIIDVTKTKEELDKALKAVEDLVKSNKTILFVGTKLPVRNIIREAAKETGMPYVDVRWLGGTLTNWKTISQRVQHLKDLRAKKKSEEWEKYPKHERMQMDKEIQKLEYNLGGLEDMDKLPDAVFVVDAHEDNLALEEAKKIGIKTIAIADTNINPEMIDYIIPANDDAISSVELITGKVKDAMMKNTKGKSKKKTKKTKKKASKDKK